MAVVRVFLCTYRRNELLRRAVASLLAQSFTDWVCELHNDDPDDPFPAQLVAELGDPRITSVTHVRNLGPTRTFNLVFAGGHPEPYVSLLEDDNWWEPTFLEVMVREMERRPDVQVGWANMRLWEELPNREWRDTGRSVWEKEGDEPRQFEWPDRRQIAGAVHSNGAMLARAATASDLVIPDETPFAVVEGVRERLARYPLLFVPTPLANYAVTRATARGNDRVRWGQSQALLVASFLRNVRLPPPVCQAVWAEARAKSPPSTGALIAAGLLDRGARYILRYARVRDWLRFAAGFVRRPRTNGRILRAKADLPRVWAVLDAGTRATQERAGRPARFAVNDGPSGAERLTARPGAALEVR